MPTKWITELKARIAANPLYIHPATGVIRCKACGGKSKAEGGIESKVPLYRITNYNEFRTCSVCKKVWR